MVLMIKDGNQDEDEDQELSKERRLMQIQCSVIVMNFVLFVSEPGYSQCAALLSVSVYLSLAPVTIQLALALSFATLNKT